ncbi:MAG: ribosome recycling factor [Gammaproteobacteria bacterium]|nr:ribosome recycling factor [Gammaproteobacteria bacterium]MCI0590702.1 ribosome recycling factor [Gammaproteobacteria bacterium]
MINEVIQDADKRMKKSVEALKHELAKLRTGRPHPNLLDHVTTSYYGSHVPLSQAATISVLDARTLAVTPWDKNMISEVEKAILNSDLGLNPSTSGGVIRVPLPPLTEERRRDMIRVVRSEAEHARVAIRNIRRDANHALKNLIKEKALAEDDERRAEEKVQQLTDAHIKDVEKLLSAKEKDLMEV